MVKFAEEDVDLRRGEGAEVRRVRRVEGGVPSISRNKMEGLDGDPRASASPSTAISQRHQTVLGSMRLVLNDFDTPG